MKEELHLFIIWEKARNKEKEIINDIKRNFNIIEIYELEWSKEKFSNNLSRFYGTNLPKGSGKEEHCGNGKFLLVIIQDLNPVYEKRLTSKGEKIVNINLFDKKEKYREMTGGGHKIHATNSLVETNHDLTLLLGKNAEDYLKEKQNKNWNGKIETKSIDVIGANEWNTVSEMFYALNNCTNYAILRNYESLPDDIYYNEHNDIDLICESMEETAYILNAIPVFEEEYRVHYKTRANKKTAYFDLRYIGDNYYYEKLEKTILKERVYNEKGFYTLNKENYFYTLLYHALIQKPEFKDDYKERLINMQIENINMDTTLEEYAIILKKWMIKNEYIIVKPIDETVHLNLYNSEYLEPLVYRKELETIKNDNTKKDNKIKELMEENNKIKLQLTETKQELEAIMNSRTWKIMEPVRKIKRKVKRG